MSARTPLNYLKHGLKGNDMSDELEKMQAEMQLRVNAMDEDTLAAFVKSCLILSACYKDETPYHGLLLVHNKESNDLIMIGANITKNNAFALSSMAVASISVEEDSVMENRH